MITLVLWGKVFLSNDTLQKMYLSAQVLEAHQENREQPPLFLLVLEISKYAEVNNTVIVLYYINCLKTTEQITEKTQMPLSIRIGKTLREKNG